jgi:hypothetical protein
MTSLRPTTVTLAEIPCRDELSCIFVYMLRLLKPSGWRLVDVIAVATRWYGPMITAVEWSPECEAIKYLQ